MSGLTNLKRRIERLEDGQRKRDLQVLFAYAQGLKTGKVTVETPAEVSRLKKMFLSLADEVASGDSQAFQVVLKLPDFRTMAEG